MQIFWYSRVSCDSDHLANGLGTLVTIVGQDVARFVEAHGVKEV